MKAQAVDTESAIVRAAGGIVCRPGPAGMPEVLLVHRPRYDDWTFPKGKLRPQEDPADAGLREVEEETGLSCRLGRFFGRTSYTDRRGRPKVADYWIMEPLEGRFEPSAEVDSGRWLTIPEALELLTYARDRDLLGEVVGAGFRELVAA